MNKEITIIGSDEYEYNLDEIDVIIIKNKMGIVFEFKPEEISSISISQESF